MKSINRNQLEAVILRMVQNFYPYRNLPTPSSCIQIQSSEGSHHLWTWAPGEPLNYSWALNNPWTWSKLCLICWCWMNNGSTVLVEFACAWPRTINCLWFPLAMQLNELSIVDWFEYILLAVVRSKSKPLATLSRRCSRSPDSWPSGSDALASGKMSMSHFVHNLG